MPTPGTETGSNGGVGGAAKQVAEHASSIAKLEIELALLELKKKGMSFALGIAFGAGAALFGLFMFGFALATVAAALATFLDTWLALLIVTAALAGGPVTIYVPGWVSHLELGWALPAERQFYEGLAEGRTLVRYDRPGCGLSGRTSRTDVVELELEVLRAVATAVGS